MAGNSGAKHVWRDYELKLKSISCNFGGRYEARLEIKGGDGSGDLSGIADSTGDLKGVTVERSGGIAKLTDDQPPFKFEVTEDNLGEQIPIENGHLKFHFSEDFVPPDGEVFILFEVERYPLQVTDEEQSPAAVYMAKLVLHPRLSSDRPPPSSGSLNLTQKLEDENIVQLGAKLWYEEKFSPEEDEPDDGKGGVSESPAHTTPPEEMAPREGSPMPPKLGNIMLLVHAASLPKSSKMFKCRPFVRCFISEQSSSTHQNDSYDTPPTQNATLSPLWEHQLIVPVDENTIDGASLVMQLTDHNTSSVIAEFQLPTSFLKPFHQYHLDMVQSVDEGGDDHLFASIVYHPSKLPTVGELDYRALEVSVLSTDAEVTNAVGPVTLAAYLCPDWRQNQKETEQHTDITPKAVRFPNPPASLFEDMPESRSGFEHCQISSPSVSETHPHWKDPFLFANRQDLSSTFTDTAVLVIYLFDTSSSFDGQSWCLKQQVGSAIQTLDKTVYDALIDPRGKAGVKIYALKLQSSSLIGSQSKPVGLNLTLRLIVNENIESTISSSSPGTLPSLESFFPPEPETPFERTDTYLTKPSPPKSPIRQPTPPHKNGYKRNKPRAEDGPPGPLPAYDAMRDLLDMMVKPDDPEPTRQAPEEEKQQKRHSDEVPDRFSLSVIESQQRELDKYRHALQKMGEEMVALQQSVAKLESEKSFLQRQLNMHEDATKALVTAENAEVITKAELLDKYVTLKQALSRQVEETTAYRDRVLTLQNQLIKLNDKERDLIKQEKQMAAQANLLQERNEKVKKLENTCRIQETALDKMEKLIKKKLNGGLLTQTKANNNNGDNPLLDSLSIENATLKAQLAQMKVDSATELSSNDAAEKLMKELQFEKASKRIASLEQEIRDKAKEWGREKTAMRLSMSADRDMNRYRSLPPLERPYDVAQRNDDYYDRGYMGQKAPPRHPRTRHSPLF